jgi:hypothetical protein
MGHQTMSDETTLTTHMEQQSRSQFSLRALFMLFVILTPVFLSIPEVANIFYRRSRGFGSEIIVLGFLYPGVLLVFRDLRRDVIGKSRHFAPFYQCIVRGACYGMLFFALLFTPVVLAEAIFIYRDNRVPQLILSYMMMAAMVGAAFGAGTGCAIGLFLKFRRWQSQDRQLSSETSTEGPMSG